MTNPNEFLPGFKDYTELRSAIEDGEQAKQISENYRRRLGDEALDDILEDDEQLVSDDRRQDY